MSANALSAAGLAWRALARSTNSISKEGGPEFEPLDGELPTDVGAGMPGAGGGVSEEDGGPILLEPMPFRNLQ